jgi:hypothetical protein
MRMPLQSYPYIMSADIQHFMTDNYEICYNVMPNAFVQADCEMTFDQV